MCPLRIHINPLQALLWIPWTTSESLAQNLLPQAHFQDPPKLLPSPFLLRANYATSTCTPRPEGGLGEPQKCAQSMNVWAGATSLTHERPFSDRARDGKRRGQLQPGVQLPHASTSWCRTPRNPRITHSDLAFRSLGSQDDQIRRTGHILFITFCIITHVK